MSGFDVTMRSQAMVNQSQQFYDAQRYESMRGMGGAIQQGAQNFVQGIRQDRAMQMESAQN